MVPGGMMMNKKLIIFTLIVSMVLLLSACSTMGMGNAQRSYEVTFLKPDGSFLKTIFENSYLENPNIISEDGRLVKWYKDSGLEHEWLFNSDVGYEGLILYGKWVESRKVTFHYNSGTPSLSVSVELGSHVDQPDNPEKEGYSFLGWFANTDLQTEWSFNEDVVDEDVNLYAKWQILIHKVRFETNGGSRIPLQVFYKGMKEKVVPEPTREGYDFKSWYIDSRLTEPFKLYSDEVTRDLTLYAAWELKQFNVTLSHDIYLPDQYFSIGYGELLTDYSIPNMPGYSIPYMPGYSIEGVYFDNGYRSRLDPSEYRVYQDLHLYARWVTPQNRLIQIVDTYSQKFPEAENDLQRWTIRNERKAEIRKILQGADVINWAGTIKSLGTTRDGRAYLSVSISPRITIGTWNNQLSDLFEDTLITMDSPLYQKLLNYSVGDKIVFSGSFFSADEDYIREKSLTIRGSMNTPNFLFKFTSIDLM